MKVPSLSMVPGHQSPKEREGERGREGKAITGSLNIGLTRKQKQKTP